MTPPDDFPGDMHWHPFDDSDADVVFGGSSGSGPVPEELLDIAELVNAARRPGSADELVDEDAIVARIAAVIGSPGAPPAEEAVLLPGGTDEGFAALHKFRTAKLAVATTAMVVMGATAAAAATGSLPSPVQSSVSKGLSGVGISVPAPHNVALAAAHTAPLANAHHGGHGQKHPGAIGVVASVNGVSDPNTCGTAGAAGGFTLTAHKDKTFMVNVSTTTTFADEGVTDPSFANVCVGAAALAKGTVADTTVTATEVRVFPPKPPKPVPEKTGAFGVVASVNGVTDPGTCGTTGAAGAFTLTGHKGTTFTVNVASTTTFADHGVTDPSFANVCVGVVAAAKGTVADTTVTAASVFVAPKPDGPKDPKHGDGKHGKHGDHHHGPAVFGTIASVNGATDPGTCGTAGAAGSFTITGFNGTTFTVNVSTTTKFFAPGVTDPSFADICVGAKAGAKGDVTDTTVAATLAFVFPANAPDFHNGDVHNGGRHHGNKHDANPADPQPNTQPPNPQPPNPQHDGMHHHHRHGHGNHGTNAPSSNN